MPIVTGGAVDLMVRRLAQKLIESLGKPDRDQAPNDVGMAAGPERDQEADWF